MCISSTAINSVGLALDIVGALLLLFFWVVPQTAFKGKLATHEDEYTEEEKVKLRRMKVAGIIGLVLLIFGFILQLISNYVT